MPGNVGRADGAHFDITGRPHRLRFVLGLKDHQICHWRWAAFNAAAILGAALCNFPRLYECISDMRDEIATAYWNAERGTCVLAAYDVDLGARWKEVPAILHQIDETLAV